MNNNIKSFADKIFTFTPEIKVYGNAKECMRKIVTEMPQVLYYIDSYSIISRGIYSIIRFNYQNQMYPKEKIISLAQNDLETMLRQKIMEYEQKMVLVVPTRVNFKWVMKCFMNQSMSFYPNLSSYSIASFQFDNIPFIVYEVNFNYRIGRVKLKQMDYDVNQEVKRLQKLLFPFEMPDSVKCFIAHNYLATSTEYYNVDDADPLMRSYIQSAYGALIKHKCVCQGYAEAYKRLLNISGVGCDVVSGKVFTPKEEWHAWNIVHLNNGSKHCHVDVTWDSKRNLAAHTYLFKGDDYFKGNREWQRHYYTQCSDGTLLLNEAKLYCKNHRTQLLRAGLHPEWIG